MPGSRFFNSTICSGGYLLYPFGVPSALTGLTSVFGMRTGVTLSPNHQNKLFNNYSTVDKQVFKEKVNSNADDFHIS